MSAEKPVIFAPGTKVRINKNSSSTWESSRGKDLFVESVGPVNYGIEYSISGVGAWIPHAHLDFVEHPTEKSIAKLIKTMDEEEAEEEER